MRTKCLLALVAVLAVAAGTSAAPRADEASYSDLDVRVAAYDQAAVTDVGPVHAAFLSDSAVPPSDVRLVSHNMIRHGLTSGRGGDCPECGLGEAWKIGPDSRSGMACDCGSELCSTCSGESCASGSCGCESCDQSNGNQQLLSFASDIQRRQLYGEVQVMWLRAHVMEDAIGKLSEQYKFSPRLVMGYEDPCGIGARVRYWHYDHTTETLDNDDFLNFGFDVVDAELTSRFAVRKTDLVVSGGARWASIDAGLNDEFVNSDMIGLTVAADLRTQICGGCNNHWAGVAGARWSTLGGNWEGSNQSIIPEVHDDNMVVQELYAGVEYLCCTRRGHNLYARLTFEIQNWHSDAASQLSGTDSIGFVGPGIHCGASF